MPKPEYRWKLELRATRPPLPEAWVTLRQPSGRLYRFLDREEAQAAFTRLKRIQPHAAIRIAPM